MAGDLRKSSGSRNLIEQGMMEAIYEKNRQINEYFEVKTCTFTTVNEKFKSRETFEQKVVLCCNLDALIERMIRERNIDEDNMLIRVGIDGGGGFLKVCLSVFDLRPTKRSRLEEKFKD